jgi:hypothetical protein
MGVVTTNEHQTRQTIRRALDELAAALEAGESECLRTYLAGMARFHRYSLGNVFLIHMQCPRASHIAGFRAWQRLGRHVRRGEKAIRILAPVVWRDPEDENRKTHLVAFRTACVFDVSQTEGKPLPGFAAVAGDPGGHLARLKDFLRDNRISLDYSDRTGAAEGMSLGGRIVLKSGLKPAEEFAVLAHEAAHELLHAKAESRPEEKTVRETEAEAVAFVVCQAVGLDTNTAASDYIQLYRGDKDTLLASLERIQRTAATITHGVLGVDRRSDNQVPDAIVPLPGV